ncbi:CRISPR system precrRNA processing endoribonuclease RAMP protein Cas6 [Niveibacterium sp. COAC-50]|uniref:CRISPR system precrRNA processing endoribonuclease RAMP protein Cas6 n=1 Tax=Niveibacterium sp. COAC-50 TaxID=2729384 RepID=UPI00155170BE|nr:CRISPR system precrRNA processing endoribonuclease RAMP protein Cas6 [Niveibacterium sp. COAC-50]
MAVTRPERLDFLALRFIARAERGFALANPYSDLHGGFGLMLHAHLRPIYEDLFGEQQGSSEVRGHVLRPADGMLQPVRAGERFAFELILVGPMVRHAAACAEALAMLGRNGVTPARHRYTLEQIDRIAPTGATTLWSPDTGWCIAALAPVAAEELLQVRTQKAEGALLDFVGPVRIKSGNDLLEHCPPPRVLIERLLARAQLLAKQQDGAPLIDGDSKRELLAQAETLSIPRNSLAWETIERVAARDRRRMDLGGLSGVVVLDGPLGELEGWLRLGEWLHIGNKTSFGLGQYRFSTLPQPPR